MVERRFISIVRKSKALKAVPSASLVPLDDSIEELEGEGADPEQLNAFLRYENTSLTVSSGFGIRNVNERLQLHFGNNSHLSYQKDSDGHLTASLFLMSAPLS